MDKQARLHLLGLESKEDKIYKSAVAKLAGSNPAMKQTTVVKQKDANRVQIASTKGSSATTYAESATTTAPKKYKTAGGLINALKANKQVSVP